jgi:DNA-binding FadR family transcriptional regulator
MLTAAERHVALAIAQQYINRTLGHYWFNSAWAAHQTLAEQVGLTRRTVVPAMATLRRMGLIAVEHGGGLKVVGGRTDRYTLRMDWLDVLEHAAQVIRRKDVRSFHPFNSSTNNQFEERCENRPESGEIDEGKMGKLPK